ncbi:MAG: hypothetical protein K0Q79_2777 [Flavipsychrobacter sp.]|jgi:hydroxymethylpyrimidine/phosphomethylpyrimidine kinase|nr:hypothetical protein [Flavipsychrobacter sp.]
MSNTTKPYVLSIAGFDPSAGAGVLADIKTFENNGVYGMGVVSALTYQNDVEFERVEWIDHAKIVGQVEVLLKRFSIKHIKIGLIESMDTLTHIVCFLKAEIDDPVIIYDPILKASAGFPFHSITEQQFVNAIEGIYCITPNIPEAIQIFGAEHLNDKMELLSDNINIYLKGGHSEENVVTDLFYVKDHTYAFPNDRIQNGAKHGSGCVLSSALTAQLALGNDLPTAAENANSYTHSFLASNETLLGYHQMFIHETHK